MSVTRPTNETGFNHPKASRKAFRIAVVIVPDRGLAISRLKEFFHPPADVAVIFVEHRGPDDPYDPSPTGAAEALKSLAPDKSIQVIAEDMRLESDHLYFLSAGTNFDIRDGQFAPAAGVPPVADRYMPDYFLSRLANAYGDRVVAILADYSGMLGAYTVRSLGGQVFTLRGAGEFRNCTCASPVDDVCLPGQFVDRLTAPRVPRFDRKSSIGDPGHPSVFDPKVARPLDKNILSLVLQRRASSKPIRIWVAGATNVKFGYGVAIRLAQFLEDSNLSVRVQIYATHFNRREIEQARKGLFDLNELTELTATELNEYFSHEKDGLYQVKRSIQQACIFASHHLAADAPFANCDLIICGDTICHLSPEDLEKVFRSIHYALNPGGYLLLPTSSTKDIRTAFLFEGIETIRGLYRRVELSEVPRNPLHTARPLSRIEQEADKILMTGYVPAAMLVDDRLQVVRFYGILSPFLRKVTDRPSLHLLKILRDELIFDLSDLLEQVNKTGEVMSRDAIFLLEDGASECQLEVVPIIQAGRNAKLVIIREKVTQYLPDPVEGHSGGNVREQRIKALERQLQKVRYQLHSSHRLFRQTQQEMQSINEELTAQNEELQSINEELRSINEQLEAQNRELENTGYRNATQRK